MNNIHIYIAEPTNKEEYHISIEEAQELTNGTCDSIVFQETNYIDIEDISNLLNLLFNKTSYGGSCFIQFNHLESIINDYNFNKINENKLNSLIFKGRRNLLTETSMLSMITSTGFLIKHLVYDEYLIKLEIVKSVNNE
jgi:hypothetical protein